MKKYRIKNRCDRSYEASEYEHCQFSVRHVCCQLSEKDRAEDDILFRGKSSAKKKKTPTQYKIKILQYKNKKMMVQLIKYIAILTLNFSSKKFNPLVALTKIRTY